MFRGKDWNVQRKICLERDNNICRRCGAKGVDVHHIIPYAKCHHNKIWNLITVCKNCHRYMDNQYIRIGFTHFIMNMIKDNIKLSGEFPGNPQFKAINKFRVNVILDRMEGKKEYLTAEIADLLGAYRGNTLRILNDLLEKKLISRRWEGQWLWRKL